MSQSFFVGTGEPGAFQHTREWLPVSTLGSGYRLKIPIITVEGAQPGPTVGLTAGIHGDEHTGTEIVRRVLTSVDRAQLRGRIRAIPIVNPLAFEARTRNTPLDMINLNRVFPGLRDGWLTEQLASVIADAYLPTVDYLLDYHAGGDTGWVDYVMWVDDRESTLATGAEYIYSGPTAKGTIKDTAMERGVRAVVTFEFGGNDCSSNPLVLKGVRCALNLMKHWDMLPGEPERPPKQYIFQSKKVIRSTQGGLLYQDPNNAVIGAQIPGGSLLARVVNPYTFEVLEELRAPFSHNLVFHVRYHDGRVNPGEYVFQCGDLDTTEIVEN